MQIHGWTIYAHPLFLDQVEELAEKVEQLRAKDAVGYVKKNAARRLKAITELAFDSIPQDPTRDDFRQGATLGSDHKHWFRAKFFQQYRLFFRFDTKARVIVYAWVNDDATLRAYDSSKDAYAVFKKMLEKGKPPGNWEQLLKEASQARQQQRLDNIATQR